jgi:RNA polymerase sigma factor (sigma-70 family)
MDMSDISLTAELVRRARTGDREAWQQIVQLHLDLVWSVVRSHRLSEADAADVSQNTWLSLHRELSRLREPDRLAAWLVTTARREALRVVAVRGRELPVEWWSPPPTTAVPDPAEQALSSERAVLLWRAFAELPERCQRILRYLAHAPELTYAQVAEALGIAQGSLGPTRTRCLSALRRRVLAAGLTREAVS